MVPGSAYKKEIGLTYGLIWKWQSKNMWMITDICLTFDLRHCSLFTILSFPRMRKSLNHLQYYSHLWSISIYFFVLLFAASFSFQTDLQSHNWQDFQFPWSQLSALLQATMMIGKDRDPLSLSPLVGCKPAIVVAAQIINHSSNSSVICFPVCSSKLICNFFQ